MGKENMQKHIITVGLSPCWDVSCRGTHLDWGRHAKLDTMQSQPAGKPLNVSRALAWLQMPSTATGLWGQDDLAACKEQLSPLSDRITTAFTAVPGQTRQNITIIDSFSHREMHLRAPNPLITGENLRRLAKDLAAIVDDNAICVFSGSLPQNNLLLGIVELVKLCRNKGAQIVLDTSGVALRHLLDMGDHWLIKPNLAELSDLLGLDLANQHEDGVAEAQKLHPLVENVLLSCGEYGAFFIGRNQIAAAHCTKDKPVVSTVGCGDYLLAGFLCGYLRTGQIEAALEMAVQVATARAWGWTENRTWEQCADKIPISMK